MRSKFFIPLAAVLGLGMTVILAVWQAGATLSAPITAQIGPPPPAIPAEEIAFQSDSGARLNGWFIPGSAGHGGVVLMHPLRADRRSMLGRARFLHRAGYSVLLFDFQAHGENEGERITFGYLESGDAHAAVRYLRSRIPGEPVAVLGISLGGAAALLGREPAPAEALILESVYTTIEQAAENRLRIRLGSPGTYLAPLLTLQLRLRLDIALQDLRPLERIESVNCPVLVIAGTSDQHTRIEETLQLFARAPNPKQLWTIKDAAHVNLHHYAGEEYERRVIDFLDRHLPARRSCQNPSPRS